MSAIAEQAVLAADAALGIAVDDAAEEQIAQATIDEIEPLLERSSLFLAQYGAGLVPVQIGVDEAMLTALVLRPWD